MNWLHSAGCMYYADEAHEVIGLYCCHRKQFFWDLIFGGFVCVRYRILIHDVESACLPVCIVEWYGSGMTSYSPGGLVKTTIVIKMPCDIVWYGCYFLRCGHYERDTL